MIATTVISTLAISACSPTADLEESQKQVEAIRIELGSVTNERNQLQIRVDELSSALAVLDDLRKETEGLKLEISAVTDERNVLKAQVEDLLNTPSLLFSNVVTATQAGNLNESEEALSVFRLKFPEDPEITKAQGMVDSLRVKLDKQREDALRLEAMGFKVLKTSKSVDLGKVKVSVGAPKFSKQFVFDRYESSYHYEDANRDYKYLVLGLSATAAKGVSDPDLPGFALYWAEGKELRRISEFSLRFARWESYATYLGNYSDSRNDFAKNATVSFMMGAHGADEELAKRPLYVVGTTTGCNSRRSARFRRPPVFYTGSCEDLKQTITLDAFSKEGGKLTLVHRID